MTDYQDPTFSRRGFAQALAAGSLLGFSRAGAGAPFNNLPQLDGELSFDPATRAEYANDYGRIVHEQPLAVLRPGSVRDVSSMVTFARRFGLKIAARGQGHQPFGQAQVSGGIVIDMRSLQQVQSFAADSVEVDAGASWRALLQATLSYGLAPPVVTKFLGLTVGGTLAIGGVGLTSLRHGAQVDQTLELQVVTGDGNVVTCSADRQRDLFDAALAGQGQCAIVTRATLRLGTRTGEVREYTLRYPDLQTLVEDGTRVTQEGRFDGAVALVIPMKDQWSYALTPIRHFTPPEAPDDAALLADLRFVRGSEQVRDVGYFEYLDEMPPIDFTQSHADLGLFMPQAAVGCVRRQGAAAPHARERSGASRASGCSSGNAHRSRGRCSVSRTINSFATRRCCAARRAIRKCSRERWLEIERYTRRTAAPAARSIRSRRSN